MAQVLGSWGARQAKALINSQLKVIRCFERYRFSAEVSNLTQGSRFHGAATLAAESAEVLPSFSVRLDAIAMAKKAGRTGIGGPKQPYASGINMLIKRMAGRAVLKTSGNIATRVMAPMFAFTTGYNLVQGVACQAGLQQ